MLGRSRFRDRGRGSGVGGANLLNQATIYLGGVAPYHWLDFINNRALYASVDVGNVTQATGYSFTRASTGYYQNADGTLTLFGSGALRRGDRGVLIEGSRTNIALHSQALDNAAWGKISDGVGSVPVVTANHGVAPDGTTTADRVQFALNGGTTTSDRSILQQSITVSNSTVYTISFYIRSLSGNVNCSFGGDFIGGSGNQIVVTSAWQRFVATATTTGTAASIMVQLRGGQTPTQSNTADLLIWGAQLELGGFVSSPIPTVAASATRAGDSLSYTTATFAGHSYWAEFENQGIEGAPRIIGSRASAGTGLALTSATALVTFNGATALSKTITSVVNRVCKGASSISGSARRVTADGLTPATDANTWTMPTSLEIGNDSGSSQFFNGYIRRVAVFNSALTDAQLQTVTT